MKRHGVHQSWRFAELFLTRYFPIVLLPTRIWWQIWLQSQLVSESGLKAARVAPNLR